MENSLNLTWMMGDDEKRHSKGYEIAKKFHCKFDMVSPVWFQVKKYEKGRRGSRGGERATN